MTIPTLTHDGLVNCPPEFFDHWIVEHTLSRGMDRFSDPSHTSMEWRLRINGSALAADVVAAHFDWERVSCGLARAAIDQGVVPEVASIVLGKAWQWGRENPTAWMILPRLFIWDATEEILINIHTGLCFSQVSFDRRFDKYCPLAGLSMTEFLLSEDLIHKVKVITRDPGAAKRFYIRRESITFNYP